MVITLDGVKALYCDKPVIPYPCAAGPRDPRCRAPPLTPFQLGVALVPPYLHRYTRHFSVLSVGLTYANAVSQWRIFSAQTTLSERCAEEPVEHLAPSG